MRGDDHAFPLSLEFRQKIGDDARSQNVEPVRRLVEHDDGGIVHDGNDERDLLLHTRREVPHAHFRKAVYAEFSEKIVLPPTDRLVRQPVQPAEKAEKIGGRKKVFQFEFAREKADGGAHFVRLFRNGVPGYERIARIRLDERGKDAEHRRFARTVGPQKPVDLPFPCGKGKPVERDLFVRGALFYLLLFSRQVERLAHVFRADNVLHNTP